MLNQSPIRLSYAHLFDKPKREWQIKTLEFVTQDRGFLWMSKHDVGEYLQCRWLFWTKLSASLRGNNPPSCFLTTKGLNDRVTTWTNKWFMFTSMTKYTNGSQKKISSSLLSQFSWLNIILVKWLQATGWTDKEHLLSVRFIYIVWFLLGCNYTCRSILLLPDGLHVYHSNETKQG